jgi:polyisoprenoid-binding protein YceI
MFSRISAAALTVLVLTTAAQADVSTDPGRAPSGAYTVEPRHTQVLFAIPHFGITDFYGRFEKISGTLSFNASAPEKSAVDITIQMTSLNTPNTTLNGELVEPNVFDVGHYPTATFKSTSITKTGATTGKISGDLTLRGVTKPATLDVTFGGGTKDPLSGGYDIGFHGTLTIKRSDFGINAMPWNSLVGDDVKLTIEALFVQQKS